METDGLQQSCKQEHRTQTTGDLALEGSGSTLCLLSGFDGCGDCLLFCSLQHLLSKESPMKLSQQDSQA